MTLSSMPESGSEPAPIEGASGGTDPGGGSDDVVAVTAAGSEEVATVAEAEPSSMFRPTMRDVEASASETGMTVKPRPMEDPADGETLPCVDPAADQALVLGPSDQEEAGDTVTPVAEAQAGTTAPAVTPQETAAPIDTASLFRDWAVMWSGNPSEVGAGYTLDSAHSEVCLCDETGLAAGEGASDLAS
ncbi:hypothetical protein [Methylobacterium tarhaniae]|uniref:hypothetical protein n=1 Tax=Methylobacterium tarhaniae TaxID=1187852 RepID=UPI003CFE2597